MAGLAMHDEVLEKLRDTDISVTGSSSSSGGGAHRMQAQSQAVDAVCYIDVRPRCSPPTCLPAHVRVPG